MARRRTITSPFTSGGGGGGSDDDSDSGGGSVGSVTRDRGGAGAGGGGEPTVGVGDSGGDSGTATESITRDRGSAGADDSGRDPSNPADAPSAAPGLGTPDPKQGVEAGGAADRVVDAATGLEQDVLGRFPDLDARDVRVNRDGDTLAAELTATGEDVLQNDPTAAISSVTRERPDPTRADDNPADPGGTTDNGVARESITRVRDSRSPNIEGGDQRLFNEAAEQRRDRARSAAQSGGDQRLRNQATPNIEGGDQRLFNEAADQQRQQDPNSRPLQQEIDFSAGLGGPEDEVERAFRDNVAEPAADFFDDPSETLPVQSAAADDSAADRAGRDFLTDTSEAVGALPGQVPETAESAAGIARDLDIILRNEPGGARSAAQARNRRRLSRVAGAVDRTATNVRNDPTELAGLAGQLGVAVGVGGATGAAGRRLSGGRIGGSDLSGRIAERANEDLRRFAVVEFRDADPAQVDLSGFGRGDSDGGSGGGLSDDLDEALTNFEESGGTDLPGDPARTSFRPEQDREADVDPSDPFQRRRDRAQRDGPDETTTGSLGLDERPTRGTNTREDALPDTVPDRIGRDSGDTVDDALDRRQDAQQRFDALASGLGAGAFGSGSLFSVGENAATGTGVGAAFSSPGVGSGTGVGTGVFGDAGAASDADIFGDVDIRSDIGSRSDTDTRLDLDSRTDTRTDTTFRTDTRTDTTFRSDTRTDTDLDRRFDFRQDFEFSDDEQDNDDPLLFGTIARSDTVDSGIQSGSEAATDLFGGGDRDDDSFSL